jgi:metallophosphoesterase superfamily enzyme
MLELMPEPGHLLDPSPRAISVCAKQLVADASGALFWPAEKALLVADIAFPGEAGGARAAAPEALLKLAQAIDRYQPQRVIALGDGLGAGPEGLRAQAQQVLALLQEDREWIWIASGRNGGDRPALGGRVCDELVIGGLVLRHVPRPTRVTHEIAGHMHPAARLSMFGYTIRRPCFVGNGRRLILPAFGDTGGLNVLHPRFQPLFGNEGMAVWMLGYAGLYPVASRFLCAD